MKCPKCHFENPSDLAYCGRCGTRLVARKDAPLSPTLTMEKPLKTLAQGTLLADRFEVLEEIGSGGMGTVYRVLDKKINEEVALKLLKPEVAEKEKTIERFKNELKLARRITHKTVCRMHDIHEDAGNIFITMEYVPGEDLKSLIQRTGSLSTEKTVTVAQQVGEGLSEAHRLGVIHRDLKPQNIMIDSQGSAKIMDFGIARQLSGPELTAEGVMIGTPHYISPEQTEGATVDQRTDIYAMGAILYEMVTGRPPFEGDNGLSVALKHKTEVPKPPRDSNARIPEELDRLILKCLSKKKEQRYQSAEELLAGLSRLGEGVTGETPVTAEKKTATMTTEDRECIESIAVLPFKDMSPQRDQDYFCEGLAEELINALTQVKGLKVPARTSSFSFKGKEEDIREIGRQLNVGSVLEGSVQKAGDRLRVTAQLICVSDGYHLWSERFDRKIEDIFAVQDEISLAVVNKLKVELLAGEKEKLTKRHTQDKKAYQLYLKGRYHWNRRSPRDMVMAVDLFQRAINKDTAYALPYVGIADVFNMLAEFGFIPPQEAYLKSKSLLQKALEIDDSLSEVYSALALIIYCYEWDLPGAERHALRAIELNPQSWYAHAVYGEILGTWGRNREALEEARMEVEADPLSSMAQAFYGIILSVMGRVEEGREQILRAIAMEPDQAMFHLWLGIVYLTKPASLEKAIEYLQKAADVGVTLAYGYLGMAQALVGQKEEALKCLAKLEQVEKERFLPLPLKLLLYLKPGLRHFRSFKRKYCPAFLKAFIYCGLKRQGEALAQLEKASRNRDYLLPVVLRVTAELIDFPWMRKVTSSPRFQALRAKIKTS
ncbi:MAG: protein kinase [Candidatus Aminicenantes bacterium]|nr:protein kinase [Candidatus Aminicenantes bacterium]